jgi:uncharacterized protein
LTGTELISALGLARHPEGGWFRRTWVAPTEGDDRPSGSAIYYLLLQGERSEKHRIDATEIWHHYMGAPLEILVDGERTVLGPEVESGQVPQVVVPPYCWQEAHSLGAFTLVGATVSPAFTFEGWELADPS